MKFYTALFIGEILPRNLEIDDKSFIMAIQYSIPKEN